MLRSTDDALALIQRLKLVENIPDDGPGPLGKLQQRLKGIEIVDDISKYDTSEMNKTSDLLSPAESLELAKENVLKQTYAEAQREAENVRLIEFLGRGVVEQTLTERSKLHEPAEAIAESSIDARQSAWGITSKGEAVEEIFSPQLMDEESLPTLQSHNPDSISAIQFVAHHVETAKRHAQYSPNPSFSASFTTESAVLAGIGYRESNSNPLTFLEITANPAQANFHAHGEDFTVQGRLYTFFVTPDESSIPFDLLSHLRRRQPPQDDNMMRASDDDTATLDNFDQEITRATPLPADSTSTQLSLLNHNLNTSAAPSPPPPYLPVTVSHDQQHCSPPPSIQRDDSIPRQSVFHVLAQLPTPVPSLDLDKSTTAVSEVNAPSECTPDLDFDVKQALVSIVQAIQEYKSIRANADSDVEPLELDAKVSSDPPSDPPAGDTVRMKGLTTELGPLHSNLLPPPYDPNENPSLPALLRTLPTNVTQRQYLLNHAAAEAEQEILDDECPPLLQRIDPFVEQYGLPIDPTASQQHPDYLEYQEDDDDDYDDEKDEWLLAYGAFYCEDLPADALDADAYEYYMFLIKGPGYSQDRFFVLGNQNPNEAMAHFLPPLPATNTTIRIYPPNLKVLDDVVSLLRREKLYPSGIRVTPNLMENSWIYTHDIHGKPILRLPKVETLFAVALALANRIDQSAVDIDYPFYVPRYALKPVYPLICDSPSSSDPSSEASSDDNSWEMVSTSSGYNPHIASGRTSPTNISLLLDNPFDKRQSIADDADISISKGASMVSEPITNIRILTQLRESTPALESKILPSLTLPATKVSCNAPNEAAETHDTVPLQCLRIRGSEEHGVQLYYFHPGQLHLNNTRGIIGYGRRSDDLNNPHTYIFLHPTTDHDAHECIAYRSCNSQGVESIRYISVPQTPYALNANKRITLDLHSFICNFLAYLEGIPIFDKGLPVCADHMKEYIRTGMDNHANIHQRYPKLEILIASALLFLRHDKLHTNKTMKYLHDLQPLVSPSLPRQLNPNVPLDELQPVRLPYYPAQFKPFEPKDPLDDQPYLNYNGCLNRLQAFKCLQYLPKYATTLGLATATTTDLLSLHDGHPTHPPLPIDDDIDWATITHPFDYRDIFYGESPRQILERVEPENSWSHHLYYLINCRRQINMLMEIFESFFRAIGFRGLRGVFRQVRLNTTVQNYPAIFTVTEAMYFTAVYDFLLRKHHFALAREMLALLNVPFSHSFDIMLLRQSIIDEIVPPTNISTFSTSREELDDDEDIREEDEKET